MPTTQLRGPAMLAISEEPVGQASAAAWIGPLVALGARASRFAAKESERQLIIAISVPRRDFAAVLIGCGWIMASPSPQLASPLDTLRKLEPQTPVRVVTEEKVISDFFLRLNESVHPPRLQLRGSQWQVPRIRAIAVLNELPAPSHMRRPSPGVLARLARLETTWDARLAAPAADLAVVGTLTWLWQDLKAFVSRPGEPMAIPETRDMRRRRAGSSKEAHAGEDACNDLSGALLPQTKNAATWFTRLYASARFADQPPLPEDVQAVVLDGSGAIKYLTEIEAPVVLCILDRSVADETAAEIVVQLRNTRGERVSIREDLGWCPPAGVEALAFTVAL